MNLDIVVEIETIVNILTTYGTFPENIKLVNCAVKDMNESTSQSAAMSEETAGASKDMNDQSQRLNMVVEEINVLVKGKDV